MKTQQEIKQLATKHYRSNGSGGGQYTEGLQEGRLIGYVDGYTQCQEDMADKMRDLLAWYMVNKGEQYRNETLFVDVVKDYINSLNKQD